MKEKINTKIDKIGMIFICFIVLLLNIYIGSSIKPPIYLIEMLSILFATIYIITKKIVNKENSIFIKSKIDIFVILLVISTILPLIFRTYISFSNTYEFFIKYISMYSIYIISRNVINTKKRIKLISNMMIISSITVIIFAIDFQYFKILDECMQLIDAVKINSDRMVGTFGYPNTLAIYLTFNLLMAIANIKETNNKVNKILYIIYCLINVTCIILTNSRSVIVLLGIIFLILAITKYRKRINKKIIIYIITTIIFIITIFNVLMKYSKPIDIVDKEKVISIRNLEPNMEYTLEFDIESETQNKEYEKIFGIEIIEVSKYLSEEILKSTYFSSFKGKQTIVIRTSDEMSLIKVNFINKTEEKYTVNNLLINENEYILNYKYVPNIVARFFQTINFSTKSVWQRGDYYHDGIQLIKENWLLGGGGNTWRYSYERIQQYYYGAKEVHSYPIEIWMSFGLLGIISYLAILVITIKNIIEMINNKNVKIDYIQRSIIIGTLLILGHSCIDFNMSFLIILILTYMMIGIINKEDKKIKYKYKILDYSIIVIFILITMLSIKDFYTNKIVEDSDYETKLKISPYSSEYQYKKIEQLYKKENKTQNEKEEILVRIKEYIELEPSINQENINYMFTKQLINLLDENKIDEQMKNIKYIINLWKNNVNNKKFALNIIMEKTRSMEELVNKLEEIYNINNKVEIKEYINEVCEIIIKEYPINNSIIKDYKKNRSTKSNINIKMEEYKKTYNAIISKMNNIN